MVNARVTRRGGAVAAAVLAGALALVISGCSGGLVAVGAEPNAAAPQPGAVSTGSPAPAATGTAQSCEPAALSLRPTAGDASSAAVNAIRARGKIKVGVAQDGFLTGYLDAFGTEAGFDVDIARQVEKAIFGTEDAAHIQFVAVTNALRIKYLQDGTVDLVADTFTINCARARQVQFSTVYYQGTQRVLVLKNSGYKSLAGLGGKKVCAQQGSTSIEAIKASKSHPLGYGVRNLTDCLVALQQGQVDAISTDDTILAGLAKQDPNTVVLPEIVEDEPYGLAVSNRLPDLIRFVNGVLERIRADGTWESIYGKWLRPALGAAPPPAAHYAG
jgi:polar amino acid transport system substrate-binding protein